MSFVGAANCPDCVVKYEEMLGSMALICLVFGMKGNRFYVAKEFRRVPAMDQEEQFAQIADSLWQNQEPYCIVWDLKLPEGAAQATAVVVMILVPESVDVWTKMKFVYSVDPLTDQLNGLQGKTLIETECDLDYYRFLRKLDLLRLFLGKGDK